MAVVSVLCRHYGHTTAGNTLFEACAKALHWYEVVSLEWGTAFTPDDEEILDVRVTGGGTYRVRVGRVREWLRSQPPEAAESQ